MESPTGNMEIPGACLGVLCKNTLCNTLSFFFFFFKGGSHSESCELWFAVRYFVHEVECPVAYPRGQLYVQWSLSSGSFAFLLLGFKCLLHILSINSPLGLPVFSPSCRMGFHFDPFLCCGRLILFDKPLFSFWFRVQSSRMTMSENLLPDVFNAKFYRSRWNS